MTKFQKDLFSLESEYVFYGADRRFVARFKYFKSDKTRFRNFLIKNFTVEEYFERLDSGMSPLAIAKSRGFLGGGERNICRKYGFEETAEGYEKAVAYRRQNNLGILNI